MADILAAPHHSSYDVVIIGGAIMGTSVAWNLARGHDFQGRILVVERDPTYSQASTSLSNSCIRQQFSTELNIRISQYGSDFIRNFRAEIGDPETPDIPVDYFGYLYLANTEIFAEQLRINQKLQARLGAGTIILSPEQIAARFPFFKLDDIIMGSFGTRNEGYFDASTMFERQRRAARRAGVEYLQNEVVAISRRGDRVESVSLKCGEVIACGHVVNAAGPRATLVAAMAGLEIPVEPRKRYIFVFDAQTPLDRALPLTIDPSGLHMQSHGGTYMVGGAPPDDGPVAPDDFAVDHSLWESWFWPAIAARIPTFEAVKLCNVWVGHYAYNCLDQNAIVGAHPGLANFIFVNGFSGHGLQQAPAMGRAVAELITTGFYQSLDLSPLGVGRILSNSALPETAII